MVNVKLFGIEKHISPLTSVVRSDIENTLGGVLSLVHSSHEAVYIFDDHNEFVGLVSPFKTLYSRNFPYTTKVSSIVYKPPMITKEAPIYKVAKYMLSAKIYTLPVFDGQGKIKGVINGKDIMQEVVRNPELLDFVSRKVEPHTPITAPITASVKEVFYNLRKKGVSRMVIVDDKGSLAGIVTRADLMYALIKPTAKMRFPKEGTHMGYYSLAGEKKFRKSKPISKYSTVLVDFLSNDTPMTEIVRHLIVSPHNSIVLVDRFNKPTGFLSTRDILRAIVFFRPEEYVPLIIRKPSSAVSNREFNQAIKYLDLFAKKLKKRMGIEKIQITSEEPKSPEGNTNAFNITVMVTPVVGKAIVAVTKSRKFLDGIQEAIKLIGKQHRRSGLSKKDTKRS